MDRHIRTVHLLHVVGRADLGIASNDGAGEAALLPLLDQLDAEGARDLLLLRRPGRTTGTVAPLASAIAAINEDETLRGWPLRLVLVATEHVAAIAGGMRRALESVPDLYGRLFEGEQVVMCANLEETTVATAVSAVLNPRQPLTERAALVWGSGATQAALGVIDAVFEVGMPWSVIRIDPLHPGRHGVFDPTAGLPVDPVIPLLRRWRYHDLLVDLVRGGLVTVNDGQRDLLEREAEHWGQAYTHPSAARLRAVMAAALLRGDATSGFAARSYICHRYRELHGLDPSQVDLLDWAERQQDKPMLGRVFRLVREETRDAAVIRSRASAGGRWLLSEEAKQMNAMGIDSSHELRPPSRPMLVALGQHLAECESSASPSRTDGMGGLGALGLAPSQTLWYVSILGVRRGEPYPIAQIAEALTDAARRARLDRPVRTYLGVPDDGPVDVRLLILGTASETFVEARALAAEFAGQGAVADSVPDVDSTDFTDEAAAELLRMRLGADAGAVIVVPGGPKTHVLPLIAGAQRVGSERGIPVFLRQLVTKDRDVVEAGTHRLPLRYGTDLAILSAALYALDIAELDVTARLLGSVTAGRGLDERALAVSFALRCDLVRGSVAHWPAALARGLSTRDATQGLTADRIDVWAGLPGLDTDIATQMRAIVGACAATESSMNAAGLGKDGVKALRAAGASSLYRVRNELPITHGKSPITAPALADLIHRCSRRRFTSTRELLEGVAGIVRAECAAPASGRPSLARLVDEIRTDVRALRDAEHRRRGEAR